MTRIKPKQTRKLFHQVLKQVGARTSGCQQQPRQRVSSILGAALSSGSLVPGPESEALKLHLISRSSLPVWSGFPISIPDSSLETVSRSAEAAPNLITGLVLSAGDVDDDGG
jgi:hypothetical protein